MIRSKLKGMRPLLILFLTIIIMLNSLTPCFAEASIDAQLSKTSFTIRYAINNNGFIDPNAPPPPKAGYKPPKNNANPQKVKSPSGKRGYPASDGTVWIPDNNMDGGPGWVREYPDKSHNHVYPNGNIRVHKKLGGQASKIATTVFFTSLVVIAFITPLPFDDVLITPLAARALGLI